MFAISDPVQSLSGYSVPCFAILTVGSGSATPSCSSPPPPADSTYLACSTSRLTCSCQPLSVSLSAHYHIVWCVNLHFQPFTLILILPVLCSAAFRTLDSTFSWPMYSFAFAALRPCLTASAPCVILCLHLYPILPFRDAESKSPWHTRYHFNHNNSIHKFLSFVFFFFKMKMLKHIPTELPSHPVSRPGESDGIKER